MSSSRGGQSGSQSGSQSGGQGGGMHGQSGGMQGQSGGMQGQSGGSGGMHAQSSGMHGMGSSGSGKKQLCVVTGASSGIGEAIAQQLAGLGYPMLLLDTKSDRAPDSIKSQNVMTVRCDVTDRKAVQRAVTDAEARFGPVDLLVNNAGCMKLGDAADQDPDEWDCMLDTNVRGVWNCTHAVLEGMKKRGCGTIINISSVAGRKGFSKHAAFCATKFAVNGFSEGLRKELSDCGVRVTVVSPGAVDTEMLERGPDEGAKRGYDKLKEKGAVLRPEQVADTVRYIYEQPPRVCIREIVLAATGQCD